MWIFTLQGRRYRASRCICVMNNAFALDSDLKSMDSDSAYRWTRLNHTDTFTKSQHCEVGLN